MPLTILETQAEQTVDDWCEVLYGEVPEQYLRECFVTAYREKPEKSIFEAYLIVKAWRYKKASQVATSSQCGLCKAFLEDSSAGVCPFHMKGELKPTFWEKPGDEALPLPQAGDSIQNCANCFSPITGAALKSERFGLFCSTKCEKEMLELVKLVESKQEGI